MATDTTRRWFLGGCAAAAVLAGGYALGGPNFFWRMAAGPSSGGVLSAPEAHVRATSGDLVLIDIRRPEEWAATGTGAGAVPLDMRREDFTEALLALTDGATDRPVALICARGVRSARLAARLSEAGFERIIDVAEGMLGSAAGPGWIARGLPVDRPA